MNFSKLFAPLTFSEDTPGTDTPGADTPGTDTSGADTPGTDTPGADTPGTFAAAAGAHTPFAAWVDTFASQELHAFNAYLRQHQVRGGYRNALFPARVMSFSEALAPHYEASRAACLRGLFIGASPILFDREEMWFATWAPTAEGTSQVWASHQDERDLWAVAASLEQFVLQQYRTDPYLRDPHHRAYARLPPDLEAHALAAAAAPPAVASDLDPGLGPKQLQRRADWIVAHWFSDGDWYGLGDGLVSAPPFANFAAKRERIAHWPNHQAYWLIHHLVFDNVLALASLVPTLELRYPPIAEFAPLAHARLAGASLESPLWDAPRVHELRAAARRKRPDLFETSSL